MRFVPVWEVSHHGKDRSGAPLSEWIVKFKVNVLVAGTTKKRAIKSATTTTTTVVLFSL